MRIKKSSLPHVFPRRKVRAPKPTVVVHYGAAGQMLTWTDQCFDFTNADDKTLGLLADNIFTSLGIGRMV